MPDAVAVQIYTHRSAGRDQAMAQSLGEMIQAAIGSGLAKELSPGRDPGADASDAPADEAQE